MKLGHSKQLKKLKKYPNYEEYFQVLTNRERYIVTQRSVPKSLREIGKEIGVSGEQVRQIEKIAARKLFQRCLKEKRLSPTERPLLEIIEEE